MSSGSSDEEYDQEMSGEEEFEEEDIESGD